jgi:hypothetical protein
MSLKKNRNPKIEKYVFNWGSQGFQSISAIEATKEINWLKVIRNLKQNIPFLTFSFVIKEQNCKIAVYKEYMETIK